MTEMQYGQGRIDWAHVELTPLSSLRLGVYVPLPRDRLALLAYRRSTGIEVDFK
ncbi:hypothetical protein [Haloarcula sebkhae]|uniref:Uncharacterized protein n=2 Tax=Haloarcula sebkhae TaxID=932660 RepID=A0ACC6VJC1_9EURY|nr:hypothetical protein [Haloarcula sebkhae]GGK74365.1 hypothetical protein GCM10009067_28220 [Haloarcula sebkhae]